MASYSRRRFLQMAAGVGAISALPSLRAQAALPSVGGGVWMAGDFHCHTVFSHDVYGGPNDDNTGLDEVYTLGHTPEEQIATAELRGLDFLAITDHNDVRSAHAPGYGSDTLLLLPGYEHSLWGGHAGVFVPNLDALTVVEDPSYGRSFEGDAAFTRFLELVDERQGMVVLNHPFYKGSRAGELAGRTWKYGEEASVGVAAVEVWNAAWLLRYETSPLYDANDDLAAQWWEAHFAGRRAMVGGSDNHWKSISAFAGVGQPTTWVFAADRSTRGLLDGVRTGRTFVSAQPPLLGGTQVFLSATEQWGTYRSAIVGGALNALGSLKVRTRVINGQGALLRLVSTDPTSGVGLVVGERRLALPDETVQLDVVLPLGGAIRAEVFDHEGLLMRAMTSAIGTDAIAPPSVQRNPTTGPPVTYALDRPIADPAALAAARLAPACECTH